MLMPAAQTPAPVRSGKDSSVHIMAKRALFAALTAVGLVLLVLGAWFTAHLGTSGTATFRTHATRGVVVLQPTLLNRVDGTVTITAVAAHGGPIFMGEANPGDATAILGGAEATSVTGVRVRDWSLVTTHTGSGTTTNLGTADLWHNTGTGTGIASLAVDQSDAPVAVVVATKDGTPADLTSLTVRIQHGTWAVQSIVVAVVGLLALLLGGLGLTRPRSRQHGTGRHAGRRSQTPQAPEAQDPSEARETTETNETNEAVS
jgi:hypothetical protein